MRKLPAVLVALGSIAACTHPAPKATATVASVAPLPASVPPPGKPALLPEYTFPPLTEAEVCNMVPATTAAPIDAHPVPYSRIDGQCDEAMMCDWVEKPPKGADCCFVANTNITRAERESHGAPPLQKRFSSKVKLPLLMDHVDEHLHLDMREMEAFRKNGFVVMERHRYSSYAVAFHDVFQQQLPVYVSADAILNAVYQSTQTLLQSAERTRLIPRLVTMLPRMRKTLQAGHGTYTADEIADLDVYLSVGEALVNEDVKLPPAAEPLLAAAQESKELAEVQLFGRARMIDFTQLTPRGYYTTAQSVDVSKGGKYHSVNFDAYFRAMMWLSRVEMNLVSRSCRSSQPGETPDSTETPREARDAIALADLVRRSGSLGDLQEFESVYATFAGGREDVTVPDLLGFGIAPGDPDAAQKLRAKIGNGFQRTARIHYMPQGAKVLPAIATLFGPRITPDIAPLTGLVNDATSGRSTIGAADVAYVLGHDRAKKYLAQDLAAYPALGAALDRGRATLAQSTRGRKDVYGTWLRAVASLAEPAVGKTPTFMRTEAFADARISSSLAGYAQIRHTFVLLAGQGYDSYGCEIPDGWVEPALPMYDALLGWAASARAAIPAEKAYFDRITAILGMLRTIAQTELAGTPLSEPQRRWLGMIAEFTPVGGSSGDSGEPPKYTGWYFDLFPDREIGAERHVDLVADYFTLTNAGQVRYLGIDRAALGVFNVDVGGQSRAMVGPVAIPYETTSPIAQRLDDTKARAATHTRAPWLGYAIPEAEEPSLDAEVFACATEARVVIRAPAPLGDVEVELLYYHGDELTATATLPVNGAPAVYAFTLPKTILTSPHGIEGFHVKVLATRFDAVGGVGTYAPYDPEVEQTDDSERRTKHRLLLGRVAAHRSERPAEDRADADEPIADP